MASSRTAIPVPVTRGRFGERLITYTTHLSVVEIVDALLGHDPRQKRGSWKHLKPGIEKIYTDIQRKEPAGRHDSIIGYLEQRLRRNSPVVGAFPAISIGMTGVPRFESVAPGDPLKQDLGILYLQTRSERILLDGLGRVGACLNLMEESEAGAAIVDSIELPLTIYTPNPDFNPLTVDDLGQLFADFNSKVYPVPAHKAMRLDKADPYVRLANDLAKEPFIANHGGMEYKANSRGKQSTSIIVQSVLMRTIRGACGGRKFQESNLTFIDNPVLTDETYQHTLGSIAGFFTEIANRMGNRWSKKDSLHLTAPGWQALGVIYNDMNHRGLNLPDYDRMHILDVIGSLDWSRYNREWSDVAKLGPWEVPAGADREQVILRYSGRNNVQLIIDYLRKMTGLQLKLDAQKAVAA